MVAEVQWEPLRKIKSQLRSILDPEQSSCRWLEADFHVLSSLLETLRTENPFVKVSKNKGLLSPIGSIFSWIIFLCTEVATYFLSLRKCVSLKN